MTKTEVATMLKEALEPFCDTQKDLRPALAHPFRQEDCVMASDGHILIAIKAKEAGDCSYCPKTVGLRIKGERTLCSLFRTNANRSVRKVKKAIKKFLREYDRQHGQGVLARDNGI